MAWSSKTQITNGASISGTAWQDFSDPVTMNPLEEAHVEVEADPQATPTEYMIVGLFGTLDDSTENWDDEPIHVMRIGSANDPNKKSLPVSGLYKWRLGYRMSASADTWTVSAWYRKNGVDI